MFDIMTPLQVFRCRVNFLVENSVPVDVPFATRLMEAITEKMGTGLLVDTADIETAFEIQVLFIVFKCLDIFT